MAVLTAIDETDAQALLAAYGLSPLRALEGVAAGSVNSNFSLRVGRTRLFLRLYEEQDLTGARRETAMLERLQAAGVPTPPPLRRVDGDFVSVVRGKPAALFPWREGSMRCQASVTPGDARRVGASLAGFHVAAAREEAAPGRFGVDELRGRLDRVAASGDTRFAPLVPSLRAALENATHARAADLPGGVIHGDLFRDNVLWDESEQIAALLDFESACAGTYAYDLMVTLLAWCWGDDLEPQLAWALCQGYESIRPLTHAERDGLWGEGCFAALRFTVTRITDYAMREGATGPRVVKDWSRFMKRFEKLQSLGEDFVRALTGPP